MNITKEIHKGERRRLDNYKKIKLSGIKRPDIPPRYVGKYMYIVEHGNFKADIIRLYYPKCWELYCQNTNKAERFTFKFQAVRRLKRLKKLYENNYEKINKERSKRIV